MSTTVTKVQVEERIREALIEFGADPDEINRDAEFEALDVDSQAVDLVAGRMS
jgi:acyl carrier protein